jgi:hypothetical protein
MNFFCIWSNEISTNLRGSGGYVVEFFHLLFLPQILTALTFQLLRSMPNADCRMRIAELSTQLKLILFDLIQLPTA